MENDIIKELSLLTDAVEKSLSTGKNKTSFRDYITIIVGVITIVTVISASLIRPFNKQDKILENQEKLFREDREKLQQVHRRILTLERLAWSKYPNDRDFLRDPSLYPWSTRRGTALIIPRTGFSYKAYKQFNCIIDGI